MTKEKLDEVIIRVKELMGKGNDPQHGYDHAERVRDNALKIIKILEIKNIDLNLLQAACILHDVPTNMFDHGPVAKHFLENYAVAKYLPTILTGLNINGEDKKILANAIRKHAFTIPYKSLNRSGDIYLKIMQDADSLDFFNRVREESIYANKKKHFSYLLLSLGLKRFMEYGRKNLGQYLNFPELAKHDWYGNN